MCVLSIKVPIRKKSGNLFNDPRTYLFLLSFNLTLWSAETTKSTIRQILFFFSFSFCWLSQVLIIWPRLSDLFVTQNTREFLCLIFQGGFWAMHKLFVRMVKFKVLSQFQLDHIWFFHMVSWLSYGELTFAFIWLFWVRVQPSNATYTRNKTYKQGDFIAFKYIQVALSFMCSIALSVFMWVPLVQIALSESCFKWKLPWVKGANFLRCFIMEVDYRCVIWRVHLGWTLSLVLSYREWPWMLSYWCIVFERPWVKLALRASFVELPRVWVSFSAFKWCVEFRDFLLGALSVSFLRCFHVASWLRRFHVGVTSCYILTLDRAVNQETHLCK